MASDLHPRFYTLEVGCTNIGVLSPGDVCTLCELCTDIFMCGGDMQTVQDSVLMPRTGSFPKAFVLRNKMDVRGRNEAAWFFFTPSTMSCWLARWLDSFCRQRYHAGPFTGKKSLADICPPGGEIYGRARNCREGKNIVCDLPSGRIVLTSTNITVDSGNGRRRRASF